MELIQVTAHFNLDGNITPTDFTWQGCHYKVESVGRRWQDGQGTHILVMIPGGRVFELLSGSTGGDWYLARSGAGRIFI